MQAVHNNEIEDFSMFKNFIIVKSLPLFLKLLRAKLDKSWGVRSPWQLDNLLKLLEFWKYIR